MGGSLEGVGWCSRSVNESGGLSENFTSQRTARRDPIQVCIRDRDNDSPGSLVDELDHLPGVSGSASGLAGDAYLTNQDTDLRTSHHHSHPEVADD
jgi:hypothetical protein